MIRNISRDRLRCMMSASTIFWITCRDENFAEYDPLARDACLGRIDQKLCQFFSSGVGARLVGKVWLEISWQRSLNAFSHDGPYGSEGRLVSAPLIAC